MADATDPAGTHRLTSLTADNHQPALWFMHIFCIICVGAAGILRFWMRKKIYGRSDFALAGASLLYLAYWLLLLFALISDLGKSDKLASPSHQVKASKLLFASRILLVFLLNLSKAGVVLLVQELFTKNATRQWFYAILGAIGLQTVVGTLMISVQCSPSRLLMAGADNEHCSGNSARWIVFTIFECALEFVLIIPVVTITSKLQTSLQNKIFTISVFLGRLVVLVPALLHVVFYTRFISSGVENIGIVPTVVMEDLWVALAIVTAATPTLMRIAKRFTTSGVTVGSQLDYSKGSAGRSRSRKIGTRLMSLQKQAPVETTDEMEAGNHSPVLRPDHGLHTANVISQPGMRRGNPEGAESIGSTAESHMEILKHVDYDVAYEARPGQAYGRNGEK